MKRLIGMGPRAVLKQLRIDLAHNSTPPFLVVHPKPTMQDRLSPVLPQTRTEGPNNDSGAGPEEYLEHRFLIRNSR